MTSPQTWYSQRLAETETELSRVKKRILRISSLRVLFFLAGILSIILLFHDETWKILLAIGCTFLPFFILIKTHNRLFHRKEWLEIQASVNRAEAAALEGDNSHFDNGAEFTDSEHPYSFDLDVFGESSLFQALNRTCTQIGKNTLAGWLKNHLTNKKEIETRQQSIKELSERNLFREQFRISGMIYQGNISDETEIRKWSTSPTKFTKALWVKLLIWGVPLVNALLLVAGIAGIISFNWFGLSFCLFVIAGFSFIKRATVIQDLYGKKMKTLSNYTRLIALTRKEKWQSNDMTRLMERLSINNESPVEILQKLSKELDRLDLRNNQLLFVILEGCIFFQLQQIFRIERWKERYGKYVNQWLEAVGEIDALCSLATFAFNHPEYTYPACAEKPFIFEAKDMEHPLMSPRLCVKNDALIPTRPYFLIITGANMAGKSTYLRTIGTNYLLACIGAPVCCASLTFYPARLITSLRTSDSLTDGESYFFAELKRLKRIIDLLNNGTELFIILDEVLKGTNSEDKQKGSFDLIRQFILLKANGLIATHDLMLSRLKEQFPEYIQNYCFEADITNDELTFSYKLREGVAQNMNACFLMKKMGIVIQ